MPIDPVTGLTVASGVLSIGKSLFGGGNKSLKQISEQGFTDEELQNLISLLTQQLGAAQQQQSAVTRQSTAGQPRSTQVAAQAQGQNQFLQALSQGISQIQAQGAGRRLRASLALADIGQRNRQGFLETLTQLGQGLGASTQKKETIAQQILNNPAILGDVFNPTTQGTV